MIYLKTQLFSPRIGQGLQLIWVNLRVEAETIDDAKDLFSSLGGDYTNGYANEWLEGKPDDWVDQLVLCYTEIPQGNEVIRGLILFNAYTKRLCDLEKGEIYIDPKFMNAYNKLLNAHNKQVRQDGEKIAKFLETIYELDSPMLATSEGNALLAHVFSIIDSTIGFVRNNKHFTQE